MANVTFSPSEKRCAVVTGGNKGIGFEICRQLASNGVRVILTARDEKRGTAAVENLKEQGLSDVVFHQLDIKDPASIASLVKFILVQFKKLDILVNNAADGGVAIDGDAFKAYLSSGVPNMTDENADLLNGFFMQSNERTEECLKTNYYGTKAVTEALLPLLQLSDSAKIVNVSSIFGKLSMISNEKVKEELNNIESLTEERIEELLVQFVKDFKENNLKDYGWPLSVSAYKMSKIALNAYTRILARKFPSLIINCVHPGWVQTDISGNTGNLTAEEGARGPVMLALLDGPSGCYFDQMELSTF